MVLATPFMLAIALMLSLSSPVHASQAGKKPSGAAQDALKQHVDDLKKNPADAALREKIIKLALTMKPAPAMPEDAERNMARGTTFAQKAADLNAYKKAIAEFEAVVSSAPWLAVAYFNLGVMQEKAQMLPEAIQNLKFYLLAAPDAKNARDVKNRVYALEAEIEDMKAVKSAPPATPLPAASAAVETAPVKGLAVTGKAGLEIEPEKQFNIIKLPPPEKKTKIPSFIGNWFFKDTLRGEESTIQAFEISKNANGDIAALAPKRTSDYIPNIRVFEIDDKTLKIDIHWRMKSVGGYWKIESYNLNLSEDGTKLSGTYIQKSVGGRTIELDRTLFRQ